MFIERLDAAFGVLRTSGLSREVMAGMLGVEVYVLAGWFDQEYDLFNPLPFLDRIEWIARAVLAISKAKGRAEVAQHMAAGSGLVTAIAAQNWLAVEHNLH